MSRTYHHGDRAKQILYGDDYLWYKSEPKWWRKMVKHKPQRMSTRMAIHGVMLGEEDVLFPLDKKPWVYYW